MDKKAIDVALISDANYVDQAQKLGAVILPEWQTKGYHTVSTGLVVAANADFLNRHSDNVKSFFKAIIEANRYLKSNIDDTANVSALFFKDNTNGSMVVDPENFKQLVSSGRVTYDLWEDTTPIIQMAGVSYELGQTKRSLTINDLYDLRFQDLLESAQNEIYGSIKN
jgi:ABC-type nitrate/sulfonate/bicarbonate transport system substrate-binding protein